MTAIISSHAHSGLSPAFTSCKKQQRIIQRMQASVKHTEPYNTHTLMQGTDREVDRQWMDVKEDKEGSRPKA